MSVYFFTPRDGPVLQLTSQSISAFRPPHNAIRRLPWRTMAWRLRLVPSYIVGIIFGPHATRVVRSRRLSHEKQSDKSEVRALRGRDGSKAATLARQAKRQVKSATPRAKESVQKAQHKHEKQAYE